MFLGGKKQFYSLIELNYKSAIFNQPVKFGNSHYSPFRDHTLMTVGRNMFGLGFKKKQDNVKYAPLLPKKFDRLALITALLLFLTIVSRVDAIISIIENTIKIFGFE